MGPHLPSESIPSRGEAGPDETGSPIPASVVIINYNGRPYLEELLGSLELQTPPAPGDPAGGQRLPG